VVRQETAVSLATYSTVVQVAHDTLPTTRQTMLQALLATANSTLFDSVSGSTTDIATATGYPTSSARRYLEELTAVKLLNRTSEGQGKADRWSPSQNLLELIEEIRRPLTDLTRSVREVVVK